MKHALEVCQRFHKRGRSGRTILFVVNVVDDLLIAGTDVASAGFENELN